MYAYRQIRRRPVPIVVDQATNKPLRLSSAAFVFDDDGMSLYRESELNSIGCRPLDVANQVVPWAAVAGLTQEDLLTQDLAVTHNPQEGRIGHAHVLATTKTAASKKELKRKSKNLAECASCCHPEGLTWDQLPLE